MHHAPIQCYHVRHCDPKYQDLLDYVVTIQDSCGFIENRSSRNLALNYLYYSSSFTTTSMNNIMHNKIISALQHNHYTTATLMCEQHNVKHNYHYSTLKHNAYAISHKQRSLVICTKIKWRPTSMIINEQNCVTHDHHQSTLKHNNCILSLLAQMLHVKWCILPFTISSKLNRSVLFNLSYMKSTNTSFITSTRLESPGYIYFWGEQY